MNASIPIVRFWLFVSMLFLLPAFSLSRSSGGVRLVTVGIETTCPYGLIA